MAQPVVVEIEMLEGLVNDFRDLLKMDTNIGLRLNNSSFKQETITGRNGMVRLHITVPEKKVRMLTGLHEGFLNRRRE